MKQDVSKLAIKFTTANQESSSFALNASLSKVHKIAQKMFKRYVHDIIFLLIDEKDRYVKRANSMHTNLEFIFKKTNELLGFIDLCFY